MFSFSPINLLDINEDEFYNFKNKSIFTTIPWIRFVEEDSKANPLIIRVEKDNEFIGYFTALIMKKAGIRIIASPFNGWSTCFMGFDFIPSEYKVKVISELSQYLFKEFKCLYIEIIDRDISVEQAKKAGFSYAPVSTLELEINKTDEELFKVFKTDCRNFIRQFERRGAILEEAAPNDEFAEEYYEQLKDVFAKQGMVPTYSERKVKCLLKHLSETDMLLCLRVKEPGGVSIASSIFLGYNNKFFFWGGASLRPYQHYRPNEYMIWYAIKYWRERGCKVFDMVGVRDYKKKFGSVEKTYSKIMIPKYKVLVTMKDCAKKLYFKTLKLKGFFEGRK